MDKLFYLLYNPHWLLQPVGKIILIKYLWLLKMFNHVAEEDKLMQVDQVWQSCLQYLKQDLSPEHYNTWVKPLVVGESSNKTLVLLAPNQFIKNWVDERFLSLIEGVVEEVTGGNIASVILGVRSAAFKKPTASSLTKTPLTDSKPEKQYATNLQSSKLIEPVANKQRLGSIESQAKKLILPEEPRQSELLVKKSKPKTTAIVKTLEETSDNVTLNRAFTFDTFVEGKANQLAKAAASQVVENPGQSYNPLFIYGGVGLGKTHLMHAVGNELIKRKKDAKIVYLHSERFVADMVKALQLNAISEFKRYYRSVDALLIDDIQFFAKKDRSQEEFFHTFNALLEGGGQVILTCDRYPKEIDGLEERLQSRFGWGLTVAVEPPELEMRVAILNKKAVSSNIDLPSDAAFFIAQRIRSNVRELEGALKRVIASAKFTGKPIDVAMVKESLKDLLALQDRQVRLDNIQRTVAEYYKIKVADLLSKRRSRSVARPRQLAMALAKELTNHSLPEIGDSFGGRDHTTVIHACRKIKELVDADPDISEDYKNLIRTLTT